MDKSETWRRAAEAMAEADRMDDASRKRRREHDEEEERERARKRRASANAVAAAKAEAKAAFVDPDEAERRALQSKLDKQRAAEEAAWRALNEKAKRGELDGVVPESAIVAPAPEALEQWQEAAEVGGRVSSAQSAAANKKESDWAQWVPKGIKFKNRAERRAAAMAAKAAAEKGETATVVGSKVIMYAAGKAWSDPTLQEWPENDFRLFVGDLGKDVSTQVLADAFRHYRSFAKAKVVRDKMGKHKGYGFVSFLDPEDYANAFKEMNGKFIGHQERSRPCKLRKSTWRDRLITSSKSQSKIQKLALRDQILEQQKELGASVAQSLL